MVLMLVSFSISGQTFDELKNEYQNLKDRSILSTENKQSTILIASAQRNIDGSARVSFLTDTSQAVSKITVEPVTLSREFNNSVRIDSSSEPTSLSLKSMAEENAISNPVMIIAAGKTVNAIKVTFRADNTENEYTLLIPLKEVPEIVSVRILKDCANSLACRCISVELSNSTCGTLTKYCGNMIGNVLNGIECNITCGTECDSTGCPPSIINDLN